QLKMKTYLRYITLIFIVVFSFTISKWLFADKTSNVYKSTEHNHMTQDNSLIDRAILSKAKMYQKTWETSTNVETAVICGSDDNTSLSGYEEDDRDNDLIMYSECGKCGSGTLIAVLSRACHESKVYHTKYTIPLPEDDVLSTVELKLNYVRETILKKTRPYIFTGHSSFIDFKEIGLQQPIYIDLVRDPVNRWISLFYYMQQSNHHKGQYPKSVDYCIKLWITETWCYRSKDIVKCLQNSPFKGCKYGMVTPAYKRWFTGRYTNSTTWSIARAKHNIERYYKFIGLTEHFNDTLKGLEIIIPRFKQGILTDVYRNTTNKNVGHHNPNPRNSTLVLMKKLLVDDYDIYEFIRQRFYIQLKCLGIR
ncbi:unnamed protein product, partial [Owenia fusiformis]